MYISQVKEMDHALTHSNKKKIVTSVNGINILDRNSTVLWECMQRWKAAPQIFS